MLETQNSKNLKNVKINFKEFNGNVTNALDKAFVEINGIPNSTGEYRFDGTFTTDYNSYKGLSGVKEDVVTGTAILVIKRIEPTIEASANYKADKSTSASNPLNVPNKSSKIDPQRFPSSSHRPESPGWCRRPRGSRCCQSAP